MYRPVAFRSLGGGLNLRDSEVPEFQAIDLLNVEFDERGAVSKRAGYAQFTGSELTNQPDSVFPHYESDGTTQLLVGNGSRLDALNVSGTSVANTSATASPHFFARFGGPTAEVTYIANGTDQVKKWDGSSFSSPTGLSGQTGMFLAISPTSNRLMVARESGASSGNSPSSVNFSDPGDPETFTSTNFVDLDPGDGEAITGMIAWRDYVFVFKPSKFFVFYGESTDATGEPIFNYKKVDSGVGLAASKAVCAGTDAVYFLGAKGVYKTTGPYAPERLSDIIEPIFLGGAPLYFKSNTLNYGSIDEAAATYHDDRLYLSISTGSSTTNDRMLVFDPRYGWWSLYDIPASALTPFKIGSQAELVFAGSTGSNYIYRHSSSYLNDAMATDGTSGNAITGRWRSGWFDYGPDVATIRESVLLGSGTVKVSWAKDRELIPDSGTTVLFSSNTDLWGDGSDATETWGDGSDPTDLWGPAGTLISRKVRRAIRGRSFTISLLNSMSNETFAVHQLVNHLRESRSPAIVETEA